MATLSRRALKEGSREKRWIATFIRGLTPLRLNQQKQLDMLTRILHEAHMLPEAIEVASCFGGPGVMREPLLTAWAAAFRDTADVYLERVTELDEWHEERSWDLAATSDILEEMRASALGLADRTLELVDTQISKSENMTKSRSNTPEQDRVHVLLLEMKAKGTQIQCRLQPPGSGPYVDKAEAARKLYADAHEYSCNHLSALDAVHVRVAREMARHLADCCGDKSEALSVCNHELQKVTAAEKAGTAAIGDAITIAELMRDDIAYWEDPTVRRATVVLAGPARGREKSRRLKQGDTGIGQSQLRNGALSGSGAGTGGGGGGGGGLCSACCGGGGKGKEIQEEGKSGDSEEKNKYSGSLVTMQPGGVTLFGDDSVNGVGGSGDPTQSDQSHGGDEEKEGPAWMEAAKCHASIGDHAQASHLLCEAARRGERMSTASAALFASEHRALVDALQFSQRAIASGRKRALKDMNARAVAEVLDTVAKHIADVLVATAAEAADLLETVIAPASKSVSHQVACAQLLADLRCSAARGLYGANAMVREIKKAYTQAKAAFDDAQAAYRANLSPGHVASLRSALDYAGMVRTVGNDKEGAASILETHYRSVQRAGESLAPEAERLLGELSNKIIIWGGDI